MYIPLHFFQKYCYRFFLPFYNFLPSVGNCYNRMADTSDEETAELVALLLLCWSWDEKAKAVTSSFIW